MSSQTIGQRFMISRGGCWQCFEDCRSQLAEALRFSSVAYNVELTAGEAGPVRPSLRLACVTRRVFMSSNSLSKKQQHGKEESSKQEGTADAKPGGHYDSWLVGP